MAIARKTVRVKRQTETLTLLANHVGGLTWTLNIHVSHTCICTQACLCQDKTGTRTSVYFGDCLTDGRFSYKLEKKPGDLETSKSFK